MQAEVSASAAAFDPPTSILDWGIGNVPRYDRVTVPEFIYLVGEKA